LTSVYKSTQAEVSEFRDDCLGIIQVTAHQDVLYLDISVNLLRVVKCAQALERSLDYPDEYRHVLRFTLGHFHNLFEITQVAVLSDYDKLFNIVLHLLKRFDELDDVAAAELVEPLSFFLGQFECFLLAVDFSDKLGTV
jgi:hypothetical protein